MKNKRTYRRKIFLILMILWMAAIFAFSSRSGDESAQDSYHAGILIGEVIIPGFEEWTSEKQLQFAETIDHPVRNQLMLQNMPFSVFLRQEHAFHPKTAH